MVIVTGNQENYLAKIEVERGTTYPSYADVPKERGGDNLYMRPGETLQGALGSCMNITARRCLNRDNIPYDRVEVQIELSVEENVTHIYTNLEISQKTIAEFQKNVKILERAESVKEIIEIIS